MQLFGEIVVYIIMACAVIGCFASIFKEESKLEMNFWKVLILLVLYSYQ